MFPSFPLLAEGFMRKRRIIRLVLLAVVVFLAAVFLFSEQKHTPESTETEIPTQIYSFNDPDWWNHAVFYEIFVRSFYDSNGDGIGDFNGITEKLDYLNDGNPETNTDLGITAIWLMPIFPSPSYHGYDVTDYTTVNPEYGTMEDFARLVSEAHKRGIHVIIDFVINHTSSRHPWFISAQDTKSEYHDWYIWSETDPGYLGPWGENVWHKAANGFYYYGVFTAAMPDLNYQNQATTDEIEKVAEYWVKDIGIDGFRVDGARHLIEDGKTQVNTQQTLQWFTEFRQMYKGWNPAVMTVGEVWDSSYNTVRYLQSDSLDMVFDFDLTSAIISSVRMGSGQNLNANIYTQTELYSGKGMGTFLSNHDMERVMSQLGGDAKLAGHAATVLLTIPGTPFLYYGEEIGMVGKKPDEQIRTPMQWSPALYGGFTAGRPWEYLNTSYKTTNVENQFNDPASLLSLYRNLIHLRTTHAAFLDGEYKQVRTSNPALYAAIRRSSDEICLIVVNLKGEEITNPIFTYTGNDLDGVYDLSLLLGSGVYESTITIKKETKGAKFGFTGSIPADSNLIFQLKLGDEQPATH